jgi:ATP synthase protein I
MLARQDRDDEFGNGAEFGRSVGAKEARKMKARRERHKNIWYGLGMFGIVGWSVAIPTIIGVALGLWLDARHPGGVSWTLTGLFAGVIVGCLNAWYWVKRESRED